MKTLVVYYSRTDITKKLAEIIKNRLDCDIEEIKSTVNYNGKMGFLRGGKDAASSKIIEIEPLKYDPSEYDLVYLGVPVWASKTATPLLSYIKQNEGKFNDVKFFVTAGGSGFDSTLKQMEEYVGKSPLKTLTLTTKEVKKDEFEDKLSSFLE